MKITNAINNEWAVFIKQDYMRLTSDFILDKLLKTLYTKEINFNPQTGEHTLDTFNIDNVQFTVKSIDLCKQVIELIPTKKAA